MSTTYSPDIAPDLEPEIVLWQPAHKPALRSRPETRIVVGVGAAAVIAAAVGALALGALAIGALAVGRADVGRARVRRLDIDDLGVGRFRRLRRAF